MKNILTICILITLLSCKKEDSIKIEQKLSKNEIGKPENTDFSRTQFKDRAEELIYIRQYLNYKLPIILINKNPDQMKKAQYELISRGENPTIEVSAKRSLHFSNLYEPYMNLIISENLSFKNVKEQLETKGELKFEFSNKDNLIYIAEEKRNSEKNVQIDTVKNIKNETKIALKNLLNSKSDIEPNIISSKRSIIYRATPENNCDEVGSVTIEIDIDKNGNVLKAKNNYRGTTTNSKCLIDASILASLNSKWNKDENAPEIQKTNITYNYRIE
jgi:hypothetical protein